MPAKPAKSAAAKKPVARKPAATKKVAAAKLPKPAKPTKPDKPDKPTKPDKKSKPAVAEQPAIAEVAKLRVKLVRDSFTMPRDEFELIAKLKARAVDFKRPAKKSELLRAGLQVLAALPDKQLLDALEALRPLKAGRPKNKH